MRTDPHSPNQYRVDGTVYNMPEFAKAFKPNVYNVINYTNYAQHIAGSESHEQGLFFFLFPNCTLYEGDRRCLSHSQNV